MEQPGHLPSVNRLSVVTASLFLVYALAQLINLPVQTFTIQIFKSEYPFNLNLASLVAFLVAVLAGLGADWILRDHPGMKKQATTQYLLIPALTAWALGVSLNTLRLSPQWWVLFALGMVLIVLVYIAEYIIVDLSDIRHIPAMMGLIAVSYALFLILVIAIDAAGVRLYLLLPAVSVSIFLVTLRTLYLRLNGQWHFAWAVAIALVIGQLAVGLHYLPIPSLVFGLLLVSIGYGLASLAAGLEEKRQGVNLWLEPAIMFAAITLIGIFQL